jgi:putative peptide zinc metalloprotease protein
MTALTLRDDSLVTLHPLHIGEEQDGEVEVGRPDTGVFIALPAEGVSLVRMLTDRMPLSEVAARFQTTHGAEVDVVDFVRELSGCGFVHTVDGVVLTEQPESDAGTEPRGWRLLARLPQRRVAWLLSRPARACYLVVWAGLLSLLVARPDLWPSAGDAFLDIGVLGNLALLTLLGWLLVFLHECAHLVAVRARGCSGTLDISHRLQFLVAQTDMSSVRVLPRNQRYAPYLAGMTWDATLLLLCLLLRVAGTPSPLPGLVAYLLAMALLFECAIFLRTDLYYVFTNLLRLGNLMQDTRRWVANLGARMLRNPPRHDLSDVPARELRVVRWFAPFAMIGVVVAVGQFVLLGLPLLLRFVAEAASGLAADPRSLPFWDSVGLLGVVGAQFGLLLVGIVRERWRRRARTAAVEAGRALIENPSG